MEEVTAEEGEQNSEGGAPNECEAEESDANLSTQAGKRTNEHLPRGDGRATKELKLD